MIQIFRILFHFDNTSIYGTDKTFDLTCQIFYFLCDNSKTFSLLSCTRRSFPNGYAGYGNWAFAPTLAITTGGTGLNHNGRANLACVDGHVASYGRAELREIGYTVVVTSADQCIAP